MAALGQDGNGSLERLLLDFKNKMSRIENGLKFLDVLYYSVEGKHTLREIKADLIELAVMCEVIREKIEVERDRLEDMKVERERLHNVQARLNHICFNLPDSVQSAVVKAQPTAQREALEPAAKNTAACEEALHDKENTKPKKGIARINLLLESDLKKIPRHVKSHLTLEQVNAGIQEVNNVLQKKYEFLKRPRKTLNRADEKKRSIYLELGKDLKGTCYEIFFTDSDIKDYTRVLKTKMKTKESVFLILRHLGKMKEIRKGKVPRYCIPAG